MAGKLSGGRPTLAAVTAAIEVERLVKLYHDIHALDGLDLAVPEGTVLGLLGPNGAGKTTCVRILSTLLKPDSGRASIAGIDVVRHPQQVRQIIGLSGQYAAVDEYLTGQENLVDRADLGAVTSILKALGTAEPVVDTEARRVAVPVSGGVRALTEAVRQLDTAEIQLADIGVRRPTLDDVFLQLTGHTASDDEGATK